jgi:hypothetical protein
MTAIRRFAFAVLLFVPLALAASGCAKRDKSDAGAPAPAAADPAPAQAGDAKPAIVERKVIKTGDLELRVEDPTRALDEARLVSERFGGYLVSSSDSGETQVTATIKVKADRFDDALAALRRLGVGPGTETVTSKDVTEEWVDVDARLRTQKKLEEQFLEILKSATTVDDALAVHKQLGEVRSEIERLEGKKKLIDHQVALSTITLRFEKQEPLIALGGGRFGRAFSQAGADAVNVGAAIVLGSIRALGVLLPLTLLIFLPMFLIARRVARRLFARPAAPAPS